MLIDLLSHKVSVEFVNKFTIKTIDTIKVGGYFLYDPLELKCATKRSDKKWISLLMHEYCHFRQYIEKSELFFLSIDNDYNVDEWLQYKCEIPYSKLKKCILNDINMECDCEKRTINMMEEYNLTSFNIKDEIKSANSYLLSYNLLLKYRSWYKKSPCLVKELLAVTPDYWLDDYTVLPKNYEKIWLKYCLDNTKIYNIIKEL